MPFTSDVPQTRRVTDYTGIIILTILGFLALAAILLVPVYRFLRREEKASERWTAAELARRRRSDPPSGNGRGEDEISSST